MWLKSPVKSKSERTRGRPGPPSSLVILSLSLDSALVGAALIRRGRSRRRVDPAQFACTIDVLDCAVCEIALQEISQYARKSHYQEYQRG
jgi:hypothetical protein